MIKLNRNYRSHEALLQVPSKLFYDDDLIACGDEKVTHSLLGVSKRILRAESIVEEKEGPSRKEEEEEDKEEDKEEEEEEGFNSDAPLFFYGVIGKEICEDNSPSSYNPVEATVIVSLIEKLLSAKEFQVNSNDIGVIAPYRLQVIGVL